MLFQAIGSVLKTATWGFAANLCDYHRRARDTFMRKFRVTANLGTNVLGSTGTYGYDNASRLNSVSDGSYSASYRYLANSPHVEQVQFKQGNTLRLVTTRNYDSLNRLASIGNVVFLNSGSFPASSHAYGYDNANQRTRATTRDNSNWTYGYDTLGQVTSAKKRFADGTWTPGEQYVLLGMTQSRESTEMASATGQL